MRKSFIITTALVFSALSCVCACNDEYVDACNISTSQCVGTDILKLCGQSGHWTTIKCKAPATCVDIGGRHACMTADELPDYTVGKDCDQTEFKQKCINEGLNALICQDSKVAQLDCVSCDSQSANPNKPLEVNCAQIDMTAKRPNDVPQYCNKATDNALCGSDGNAWFCGETEYYLSNKGKCKDKNLNCIVCPSGYVTCGTDEESACHSDNTTERPSDIPETCSEGDPAKCSAIDGNAWFCGDNGYYLSSKGKCREKNLNCIACPNGYVTCGTDEESACHANGPSNPLDRPSDIPQSCSAGDAAKCSAIDGNAWFCGDNGYYLSNKGKCRDKGLNCIVCPSGYVTCGTDENSACHSGSTTERPSDIPETCTASDGAKCSAIDGNAWFCGDNGYYLSNKGKCAEKGLQCIRCTNGYVGCAENEQSLCHSSNDSLPDELKNKPCDKTKDDEKSICGSDGNLYYCGDYGYFLANSGNCKKKGTEYSCYQCTQSTSNPNYKGCAKSEVELCNSSYSELPAELKNKPCDKTIKTEKAICGSDENLWLCGDYGYYLPASGKCKNGQKCYACDKSGTDYYKAACADSQALLCNSSAKNWPDNIQANPECNWSNENERYICGDDGNMWTCGDYGYYLSASGKCVEKSQTCYSCPTSNGKTYTSCRATPCSQ